MAELAPPIHDAEIFANRVRDTRKWFFQAREELARANDADEATRIASPFEANRDTSSRLALTTFAADTPRERGIRAHVYWLLQKRLLFSFDRTIAGLVKEKAGTLRLERAESISFADAKRGLLTESHPARTLAYLEALESAAPEVSAQVRARQETRTEIARQLALETHDAPFLPEKPDDIAALGRTFLDRTRDVARAQRRASGDGSKGVLLGTFGMLTAGGEHVRSLFPARLNHAWLHDTFPHLATSRIDPRTGHAEARRLLRHLPSPYFATSFARALYQLGCALGAAVEETPLQRVTRADPSCLYEASLGNAFAALLLDTVFLRRALGLGMADARAAVRAFASSTLVTGRLRSACVRAGKDAPNELAEEVFGAELPEPLQNTFISAHDDAGRDFLAILRSISLTKFLRDTFDEDWFRNPRTADAFLAADATMTIPTDGAMLVVEASRTMEELLA